MFHTLNPDDAHSLPKLSGAEQYSKNDEPNFKIGSAEMNNCIDWDKCEIFRLTFVDPFKVVQKIIE